MICYICDICNNNIKCEPIKVTVDYSEKYKPINKHLCSRCWQKIYGFIDDMKDGAIND